MMVNHSEIDDVKIFTAEALELLECFIEALLVLEKEPQDKASLDALFRIAHTLKGTSSVMGFEDIKESMHAAEELLDSARSRRQELSREEFDLLLAFSDAMMCSLKETSPSFSKEDWVNRLRSSIIPNHIADQKLPDPSLVLSEKEKQTICSLQEEGKIVYGFEVDFASDAPLRSVTAKVFLSSLEPLGSIFKTAPDLCGLVEENYCRFKTVCVYENELSSEEMSRVIRLIASNPGVTDVRCRQWVYRPQEAKTAEDESSHRDEKAASGTVRVDSDKLQKHLDTVGNLMSVGAGLDETIQSGTVYGPGLERLKAQMQQLTQTLSILQAEVMQLYMVPVKQLFHRYTRIVRDQATKSGKRINLSFQGETMVVDKKVLEALADPLTHIVLNALSHGIERPEVRRGNGKPETGLIKFNASREGRNLVIEVRDDGEGVDLEKVYDKAIEQGVAQGDRKYSETELMDFLFTPGFSTNDRITELSGRGVGLDVVRTNLRMLNGDVTIHSTRGTGTVFRLVVPLSLILIEAFLATVDGRAFAISAEDVLENRLIKPKDILEQNAKRYIRWGNEAIPLVDLGELYNGKPTSVGRRQPVLVLETPGGAMALIADEFLESREVMVKPGDSLASENDAVYGIAVFDDGQVAMALEPKLLSADL